MNAPDVCPLCGKAKHPSMHVCRKCWSQVPKDVRDQAYRTGQKGKRPSVQKD